MISVFFLSIVHPNNCTCGSPIVPILSFSSNRIYFCQKFQDFLRERVFLAESRTLAENHLAFEFHTTRSEVVTPLGMSANDGQENVWKRINLYRLSCQVSVLKVSWCKCKKSDDLLVPHHLFFGCTDDRP